MSTKSFLIQGPIKPDFIAAKIAAHQSKTDIGAHAIFLGQVRADETPNGRVTAIDYSAYTEMANEAIFKIKEDAFVSGDIRCLHVYHSMGRVKCGEISLFVFVSSGHRKASMQIMEEVVEKIKADVPIWKKEITDQQKSNWVED